MLVIEIPEKQSTSIGEATSVEYCIRFEEFETTTEFKHNLIYNIAYLWGVPQLPVDPNHSSHNQKAVKILFRMIDFILPLLYQKEIERMYIH
jgi:hypothetical protein